MWRAGECRACRLKPDNRRRVSHACIFERRDDPQRIQVQRYRRRLTVSRDGPCQSFVSKILGNGDGENTPLTPRKKVSGLPLIRAAWIDVILGSDWNIERLFLVSIEIADEKTVAAVAVFIPSFKRASNAGARVAEGLERQLRLCKKRNTKGARDQKKQEHDLQCAASPISCAFRVPHVHCWAAASVFLLPTSAW